MEPWRGSVSLHASLRWLGAPATVVCLAVMALNDHVLKQAWPGLVTGKLSDVAGLVVAPPLLAVVLVLVRVPRAALVALVATALGFGLAKSTYIGSDIASAVWSAFGFPTLIRRDPTDLLALPALLLAARVEAMTRRPGQPLRQRVYVAIGALLLPFAVFATAATSCDPWGQGVGKVSVVTGDFTGSPAEPQSMIVVDTDGSWSTVDQSGAMRDLAAADIRRIGSIPSWHSLQCDPANRLMCWRTGEGRRPSVEESRDGGQTWRLAYEVSEQDFDAILEDLGDRCGDPPGFGSGDLAVLETPDGPVVAVAAGQAGLLLHEPARPWRRLGSEALDSMTDPAASGKHQGRLVVQDPPERVDDESGTPDEPPVPDVPLPCQSPTTATITPDPRNGSPFLVHRCPDGSSTRTNPPQEASVATETESR